ncbi:uncharacterized protein EDB91DRAFT_369116 [Suillus paluster]|uniref:uncharacterized protein n=1 Tax=Suillus paluster TaxID=48578 RepID=UPI001B874905|nr:uncharacterized protein EDB91DRAFT_369116 [Suillus paluster]KAG1739828.1 hypothetical protein EDB91DRAFT_369116 [Suillus paluster]
MAASSKPREGNWYPYGLLAYDTLPNRQDDSESIIVDPKPAAGASTDFYDRGLTTRRYAVVGVMCTGVISCCCITAGTVTLANHGVWGVTNIMALSSPSNNTTRLFHQREILALTLNLIVTLCTESIGFVHGISLRSALASESRLRFNTNLRLLAAARGWSNPNGALLNGIMSILLIISYSSSSLVLCFDTEVTFTSGLEFGGDYFEEYVTITGLPLLMLGLTLLLQVVIALSGLRAAKISTWSSSPFDLTAALVHQTQLTPVPFRCVRGVSDLNVDEGPGKPSETQPSAWRAHPSIRKVIISLWGIVVACAGWAALVMFIWHKYNGNEYSNTPALTLQSWSFFLGAQSNYVTYAVPGGNVQGWILVYVQMAVVQGPLTLGLHYSELIANVIRDERQWRCATRRKGLRTATNPLKVVLTDPCCLVLFLAKPFLHWMFGLSFISSPSADFRSVKGLWVTMGTAQIWNLCIALSIFACFFTLIALHRPRGSQPAAYGHLQTLANLVDEWSPVMWWGHKEDGIPYCHAGRVLV